MTAGADVHACGAAGPLSSVDAPTLGVVEEARGGSRAAFGSLVELHWSRLVRLARSVVGEADAPNASPLP